MIVTTRDAVYIDQESLCDGRKGIVMFPCEAGCTIRVVDAHPIGRVTPTADIADAILSDSSGIIHGDDTYLVGAIVPPDVQYSGAKHPHCINVLRDGERMYGYLYGIPACVARNIFFRDEVVVTKHAVCCPTHVPENPLFKPDDVSTANVLTAPRTRCAQKVSGEGALNAIWSNSWSEIAYCLTSSDWSTERRHVEAAQGANTEAGHYAFGLLLERLDWTLTDDDVKCALNTNSATVISSLALRPDLKLTKDLIDKLLDVSPAITATRDDWTPTNELAERLIRADKSGYVTTSLALRLDWSPSAKTVEAGLLYEYSVVSEAWRFRLEYIAWKRGQR